MCAATVVQTHTLDLLNVESYSIIIIIIIILLILLLLHFITPVGLQLYFRDITPCRSISQYKKSEVLMSLHLMPPIFTFAGNCLSIENFSSTLAELTFSCDSTIEILRRINLASSAFDSLREREFSNRSFTIHTKIAIYNAVVIFTILFVCESCVPYQRHIRMLESFPI